MPMQIILPSQLRQQIMADYHIEKSQMSRILHFKINSHLASEVRNEILNHHPSILV